MAKELIQAEQKQEEGTAEKTASKPFLSKKLIIIGIPIFVVQLAVIYFLAVKFIAPSSAAPAKESGKEAAKSAEHKEGSGVEEQNIFVVKDVIVNPAGTNGTRFLLTTVGFEVSSPECEKELEKKEVQVRDALNTVLTSKGLDELVGVEQREALRAEVAKKVGEILRTGSLSKVYFSKFIIQ